MQSMGSVLTQYGPSKIHQICFPRLRCPYRETVDVYARLFVVGASGCESLARVRMHRQVLEYLHD